MAQTPDQTRARLREIEERIGEQLYASGADAAEIARVLMREMEDGRHGGN